MAEREVRLFYRDPAPLARPLLKGADTGQLGWLLLCALIAAIVPKSGFATVMRAFARLKCKERAKVATKAIAIGGLAPRLAKACIIELFAGRIETYLHLFRALIWRRDIEVNCRGLEHLNAALTGARGAVLWIADFTEAPTATKIGFFRAGNPLAHLSRPEHGFSKSRFGIACLNPLRTRYEDRFLHQRIMFDRQRPQLAETAILLRLGDNGVVSVMASAYEGRAFADVEIYSGWLRLATGPLRLARKAGCPILPVFTVPGDAACSYEVIVERQLSSASNDDERAILRGYVVDFAERLESYVGRWPAAWVGWRRSNLAIERGDLQVSG
jgi:hypothetical protein